MQAATYAGEVLQARCVEVGLRGNDGPVIPALVWGSGVGKRRGMNDG